MHIAYKNKTLEKGLIGIKVVASVMVIASFVILFGFDKPLVPASILFKIQLGTLCIFLADWKNNYRIFSGINEYSRERFDRMRL